MNKIKFAAFLLALGFLVCEAGKLYFKFCNSFLFCFCVFNSKTCPTTLISH